MKKNLNRILYSAAALALMLAMFIGGSDTAMAAGLREDGTLISDMPLCPQVSSWLLTDTDAEGNPVEIYLETCESESSNATTATNNADGSPSFLDEEERFPEPEEGFCELCRQEFFGVAAHEHADELNGDASSESSDTILAVAGDSDPTVSEPTIPAKPEPIVGSPARPEVVKMPELEIGIELPVTEVVDFDSSSYVSYPPLQEVPVPEISSYEVGYGFLPIPSIPFGVLLIGNTPDDNVWMDVEDFLETNPAIRRVVDTRLDGDTDLYITISVDHYEAVIETAGGRVIRLYNWDCPEELVAVVDFEVHPIGYTEDGDSIMVVAYAEESRGIIDMRGTIADSVIEIWDYTAQLEEVREYLDLELGLAHRLYDYGYVYTVFGAGIYPVYNYKEANHAFYYGSERLDSPLTRA